MSLVQDEAVLATFILCGRVMSGYWQVCIKPNVIIFKRVRCAKVPAGGRSRRRLMCVGGGASSSSSSASSATGGAGG